MNPDAQSPQPQIPEESDLANKAAELRRPVFDPTGRIEQINPTETKIADVRRHPFGLFLVYLQIFVALSISLALIFFALPSVLDTLGLSSSGADSIAYAFGFIGIVLGVIFLILATRIYQGNQLIITNVNITQVTQVGLFNRKVSELSMANVEDVTAQQRGIFPTLFNYGRLVVETAGEQTNFVFEYCPNPNAYAKAILDARQNFVSENGE